MDRRARTETYKWLRDLILSVVVVPLVLGSLKVPVPLIIVAAVFALIGLKAWEQYPDAGPRRRQMTLALIGMGVFGAAFLGCATFYFWPAERATPSMTRERSLAIPSLASLFMSDFAGKGSGGGIALLMNGFADLTFADDQKFRVFYNVIEDFGSQSKFICFYVQPSQRTYDVLTFIAANYKQYLNSSITAETGGEGSQTVTRSSDLVFTGRIFVYYETPVTLAQLGELDTAFRKNGASVEFRTTSYALAVLSSIRAGDSKPPPAYEMRDNLLRPVKGTH